MFFLIVSTPSNKKKERKKKKRKENTKKKEEKKKQRRERKRFRGRHICISSLEQSKSSAESRECRVRRGNIRRHVLNARARTYTFRRIDQFNGKIMLLRPRVQPENGHSFYNSAINHYFKSLI